MEKNYTVVTRHPSLVEYLRQDLNIEVGEVISHATPADVKGKDVIGVLPHSLSCLTASFSEVPLKLTPDMRGRELTLDEIRQVAGELVTYKVTKL